MSDVLDELEGLELRTCRRCGAVTWASGDVDRCAARELDSLRCGGLLTLPFRECSTIGWYDWPHRHLVDGRLLALEPLLDGWRLHVIATPWDAGSREVYEFPLDNALFVCLVGVFGLAADLPDETADVLRDDLLADPGTRVALRALHGWNGEGEPSGWYRHKPSNRRRPGGDPTREEVRE